MKINFNLNYKPIEIECDATRRLIDVLRTDLALTSLKEGCGEGSCGACVVLLDNVSINSCLCPVGNVIGRSVVTLEGFKDTKQFEVIKEAYAFEGGSQCGFCTPGMIIATQSLLLKNPHPTDEEIQIALSGNLCRCTGYQAIIRAVKRASIKGDGLW